MDAELEIVIKLLAAIAIGLLIGIERGWSSKQEEEGSRVAGIRTFSLIGLLGGIWAILSEQVGEWVLAIAFAAVAGMSIASYIMEVRTNQDIGTTTAYTIMITFALGAWAAFGFYIYALGSTALVVTLLGTKPVLHKWLKGIEPEEIYAWIKMLIISVVLLPLLPDEGYGPWEAFNPRWVWWMVVLISGISFVGYFAIKYVGNTLGTLLTSLIGGLASSTAVTLSMAQFAKRQNVKTIFMAGVMIASSIMFIRVSVEVSIVNPQLLYKLWIPLLTMFISVLAGGLWLWMRKNNLEEEPVIEIKNPFNIITALKFGAFLGLILVLSVGMKEWFGDRGLYVLSVFSGLMDVDAITVSLSRLSLNDVNDNVAVFGIILATATNTVVKSFMFAFFAGFRESLKLIGLMFIAAAAGMGVAVMTVY